MVGIWAGATFCSFVRARTHARTCQNGIVGVSSPGSIFPGWFLFERRDMQSSALPYELAASGRSFAFCYPPLPSPPLLPLFSMLSSKHDAFLFSLPLSLLEERNVSNPNVIKGVSDICETFYMEFTYRHVYVFYVCFIPKSDIVLFLQCRGSRIYRELLFVYESFIERIRRYN